MKALFAGQAKGKTVNPSTIVLSASDPYSEYVQDAVTNDQHPWAHLVTHQIASDKRLTPSQARAAIVIYAENMLGSAPSTATLMEKSEREGLDKYRADQLAELINPFGTKEDNPTVYRAVVFRAVVGAGVVIVRHHNAGAERIAVERWKEWMPKFQFAAYQGVTSTNDYTPLLIAHWNKRLQPKRRIPMPS